MKRITIFAISILIASSILVGAFCAKTFAVLPPKIYEKQRAAADAHVIGKIISYEIQDREDDEKSYSGRIFYDVEVTETIKGGVKPGAVITLSKSCMIVIGSSSDSESTLYNHEDEADCLSTPIKIGDSEEIYMNEILETKQVMCIQPPCPSFEKQAYIQALGYGPKVEKIDFTNANNDYINMSVWQIAAKAMAVIVALAITITVSIFITKKKNLTSKGK